MDASLASLADSSTGETVHDGSGCHDSSSAAAAARPAAIAADVTLLPSSSSSSPAVSIASNSSSSSQLKPVFLTPAAASHTPRSTRLTAAAAPAVPSAAMTLDFAFPSPQPRMFAPFSSPHMSSPHLSYQFSPSAPPLDQLAPPLCLPPSAFYFDSASYADDSTVSGVDDFPLLPSVTTTEEADHAAMHSNAFAEHDAQHQLQHFYHKEQQQLLPSKGGQGEVALSLTPALHAVAAAVVSADDAQDGYSAESASAASESPVFSTHASSLPPLSPVLSGHSIASSDPHSLPTTPCLPASHRAACPPLLHGQLLPPPAPSSPQLRQRAASSIFDEPQPQSPPRPVTGLPVVPLSQAPTDSICSAPFLPPITHPALPFSPPVPLSQSPSSSLIVSNYIDAAHCAVLNHAKSLQSLPSLSAQQRADAGDVKRGKLGKKSSGSVKEDEKKRRGRGRAKQTKAVLLKKGRKRKRDDSSSSDDSDGTVTESSSEDDGSDDDSAAAAVSASSSALSATARKHRQVRKRQRNKEAAVAYRQRKKALTLSLYTVANTLKATVQQQSQLIDEVQQDNARLRQQLGFIHNLLNFSQLRTAAAPASPPAPQHPEHAAAEAAVAAMPGPSAPPSPPAAVPAMAAADAAGVSLSLPSPEATAIPSVQAAAAAAADDAVVVKPEPAEAAEMVAGCSADSAGGAAAASGAQRAGIFLFVIFSCFLLFNPQALQPANRGNDPAFTELTALLLHQHYQQQQPQEKQAASVPPPPPQPPAEAEGAADAASSELWTAGQREGLAALRSFLSGQAGCNEDFFSHLLDTAYTPLVRVVGEAAAQQAISQLASGVLLSHQKRQHQQQTVKPDLKAEESSEAAAAAQSDAAAV